MKQGKVKFYNDEKGYGFITDNETGEDVFVHRTGIVGRIQEDDDVQYNTEQGKKGINAVDVTVVD